MNGSLASAPAISVMVNDAPRQLGAAATVHALVAELGLADRKGVALAVNGSVVPRSAWTTQALADGDRVLVIRATQGG